MKRMLAMLLRLMFAPLLLLLVFQIKIFAQNENISGKVTDSAGVALANATVKIAGTNKATKTNDKGEFSLQLSSSANTTLVVSYIGYFDKEVKISSGESNIIIALTEEPNEADEIIVTGVFDKRKRIDASVAITTLNASFLQKQAAVSAADLLKNVPGVYVNSSLGEIRNTVYSRGVSVGSNDGASGYYYVSLQEDGLPVTNATYGNYGPDYFLRPDATLGRLEAVRGGTASITSANAPGGIFNYVMKEGGAKTEGEVITKYGLEGNGHNNFYRTDFNVGGSLGNRFYYDAGGFYRYDEGNRNPGYPINKGGQFRGNIVKKYKTGLLKLYAKYLNDHNGWFEFTPTSSFTDPKPLAGFTDHSSVLSSPILQNFPINQTGKTGSYYTPDLIHSKDYAVGLNWEQRFGTGWTFNNAIRYSDKSTLWNTNAVVYPLPMDDLVSYAIIGLLGKPGTYSFKGANSGKELLSVTSFSGYDFNVNQSSLPGSNVLPNSLFFEPLFYQNNKIKELLDQFSLNKKIKNNTFTIGGFIGHSNVDKLGGTAGLALQTIQDNPQPVIISLTNPDGTISQVTNSNGVLGVGGAFFAENKATQNELAFFFGHSWQINDQFNFDWGVRYDNMHISGYNTAGQTIQDTSGGIDGNKLTLYDDGYGKDTATLPFDKTVSTFSYSGGLNYKISNTFALYGRYSQGSKAPDLDIYFNANTDFTSKNLVAKAQKVQQIELGIKVVKENLNIFVTPFYSILSNVPNVQTFQNADQSFYSPSLIYNKLRTYGVEVESDYSIDEHFHVRGVLTLQKSKAIDYGVWLAKNPGAADDSLVSYSGNETDNIARSLINITPSYTVKNFFAQLTWSYIGKRQANVANAFLLPSFSQFNFAAGYDISKHLQLSFNINNVLNKYGVMSWSRPGSFLQALDRQGFTKEMYDDAVKNNTPYSTIAIPARSYFLSATFKF